MKIFFSWVGYYLREGRLPRGALTKKFRLPRAVIQGCAAIQDARSFESLRYIFKLKIGVKVKGTFSGSIFKFKVASDFLVSFYPNKFFKKVFFGGLHPEKLKRPKIRQNHYIHRYQYIACPRTTLNDPL